MSIEAMKQVIEAFDALPPGHPARYANLQINALRTALSQQPATPEPMTDDQMKALVDKAAYDEAPPEARTDFVNGIRWGEHFHGITSDKEK